MQLSSKVDDKEFKVQKRRQFIMNASRCSVEEYCDESNFTWAAANALGTEKNSPLKKVGFLPVITHPVTQFSTVCYALRNVEDIRKQLSQEYFPVVTDEGMFQIAMDILLSHPSEFKSLFPMTGIFHMTKTALHCAGLYFRGSGIDTALILSKCFGENTMDSVLSGGHYVRSLLGMQVIKDAFEVLIWEAFWKSKDSTALKTIKAEIKKFRIVLNSRDPKNAQNAYKHLDEMIKPLIDEMKVFKKEGILCRVSRLSI